MRLLRVAFKTLGCKLNQLETESVADAFLGAGAVIRLFNEAADLYVVNTCTVTSKAEQKARRVMRQALLQNPQALVLVTGCYAQMDPEGLSLIHPRSVVLPGEEKSALLSLAAWLQENWQGHGDLLDAVVEWKASLAGTLDPFAYHPKTFAFHSRPSLKIEDGCDNRCAYCRVCLARGPAVSLAPDRVLERVLELEKAGKAEIVLTGINLAQYRSGAMRFPDLLGYLLERSERVHFRLSSYEPEYINEAFLKIFANPRIQPHVHLALQSGSDTVLRRMARPYTAQRITEAVAALRATREDPFIAADMILGFPGETELEFEASLELCRALDLAWIHAFPFSARPGTKAYEMRPKIPERVMGERVAKLSELAGAGLSRYVERWIGKKVSVILEKECNPERDDEVSNTESSQSMGEPLAAPKGRVGTSANYLRLRILDAPESSLPGARVDAIMCGFGEDAGVDAIARLAQIPDQKS